MDKIKLSPIGYYFGYCVMTAGSVQIIPYKGKNTLQVSSRHDNHNICFNNVVCIENC